MVWTQGTVNLVLGVDGGNTKTLALVAREDGVILGAGRAGCGDIYGATSAEAAIAEIEQAVEVALTEAGIRPSDLSVGAFSLAGADWPEDFKLLEDTLRGRGYGQRIVVVNDAMRSEEHTSELQSLAYLVCRLLLEKKK